MSIHVYFLPIDVALFQGPVFDYLCGVGSLDVVREEIVRVVRARRMHSPWWQLVWDVYCKRDGRLPAWFDSRAVFYERPLLIVEDLPARVGELVERYHTATGPDEVRRVAQSQLALLDPEGWDRPGNWQPQEPDFTDVDAVVDRSLARLTVGVMPPVADGFTPPAEWLERVDRDNLDLKSVSELLKFNQSLQPAWELRYWFTESIRGASRELNACFETPHALFEPLLEEHPELESALSSRWRNERVGLYIRPENVPAARLAAEAVLPTPVCVGSSEKEEPSTNALRRLAEVLCYAERRGLGFAERIS